jgi:protein LSM14
MIKPQFKNYDRRPQKPKMVIPTEEFDFEQSNAKFTRAAEYDEDVDDDIPEKEGGFYKKSSFFDDISSDMKDRSVQNNEG